jgi:transcription initiation factor TFIIIB Brf1 subunit/transcription initiation factor TFIIB
VFDFVEIHGDYTCQNCGLVKYTHAVDDSVQWDQFDHGERLLLLPQNKNSSKLLMHFRKLLRYMEVDNILEELAIEWYSLVDVCGYRKKRALMALSTYCASLHLRRGRSIESIESVFSIAQSHIWGMFLNEKVTSAWNEKGWYKDLQRYMANRTDRLSRSVHELICLPRESVYPVLKNARSIYDKVHMYPQLSSLKTHTLQATCIYIACKISALGISTKVLCKDLNVCWVTLSKNELLIQKALGMQDSNKAK